MIDLLNKLALRIRQSRKPDFVIGEPAKPYLLRWWVIPRNRFFNIYLHHILRDDDDRALHDHPWINLSIIVSGGYHEHTIDAGGINRHRWREAGDVKLRLPRAAHRLEVSSVGAVTFFITGPRVREWGFHCPDRGWVHWRDFTAGERGELVGAGCGEAAQ